MNLEMEENELSPLRNTPKSFEHIPDFDNNLLSTNKKKNSSEREISGTNPNIIDNKLFSTMQFSGQINGDSRTFKNNKMIPKDFQTELNNKLTIPNNGEQIFEPNPHTGIEISNEIEIKTIDDLETIPETTSRKVLHPFKYKLPVKFNCLAYFKKNKKPSIFICGVVLLILIILIFSPEIISKIYCKLINCSLPPPEDYGRYGLDPIHVEMMESSNTEEKEIIKSGIINQALNPNAKQIYRWYPLYEIVSYWIEVFYQAEFNSINLISSTNNEKKNINSTSIIDNNISFNIDFITKESKKEYSIFYLLINKDNITYNYSDIHLKNSSDNDTDDIYYIDDINEAKNGSNIKLDNNFDTNNKSDYFQLNLIICNASRVGITSSCKKPSHMKLNYFMIAMNALDQFIPILNKTYMNVYQLSEISQNSISLSKKEEKSKSSKNQTIEGILGGNYEKHNDLIILNNINGNSDSNNSIQLQLQTRYEQNSLGRENNLSTETQSIKIQKNTYLDFDNIIPDQSEIIGEMNLKMKGNLKNEGILLNIEDFLCDNLLTNFTITMKRKNEIYILREEVVTSLKEMSDLMKYEEILNPIDNNTIYIEKNSNNTKEAEAQNNTKEAQNSGDLIYSHREIFFKNNIMGIFLYGVMIISCYTSDKCSVIGNIYVSGMHILPLFNKEININLTKIVNTTKVIQLKSLQLIKNLTKLLDSTNLNLRNNSDTFIEKNKNLNLNFVDSIDQLMVKYDNIFNDVSNQFSSLGSFIENILSIMENEFFSFLENHYNFLENSFIWLDVIIDNVNSTINELQCSIINNETMIEEAVTLLPVFYETISVIYSNLSKQYNDSYNNGSYFQIYEEITQIINNKLKSFINLNVINTISDFIARNLDPSLNKWNSILKNNFEDGKVKLITKFIESSEKLNNSIEKYSNFLNNANISYCQSIELPQNNDISQLLSEKSIKQLFEANYFSLKSIKSLSNPTKTIEFVTIILEKGLSNLFEGVQVIILNSNKTFDDIYNFSNQKLTNSANYTSLLMQSIFSDFNNSIQKIYQNIKDNITEVERLFNDVYNSNYIPTHEDLKELNEDFIATPDVIDSFFHLYNQSFVIFKDSINSYNSSFYNLSEFIYSEYFKTIDRKFISLNDSFQQAQELMINKAVSFKTNLSINEVYFDSFQKNISDVFVDGKSLFEDHMKIYLVKFGEKLLQEELTDIFNLKNKLNSTLDSLLPKKDVPLLEEDLQMNYSKNIQLLVIPIVVGKIFTDSNFNITTRLQFYWGFSRGKLYINIVPWIECYAEIKIYEEINYKMGIYYKYQFFKGSTELKIGHDMLKFKYYYKFKLSDSAESYIGNFFQKNLMEYLWINFETNGVRIIIPYITFFWLDKRIMSQNKIISQSREYSKESYLPEEFEQ